MRYKVLWCDYDQVQPTLDLWTENGWTLHTAQLNDREGRWYLIFQQTIGQG